MNNLYYSWENFNDDVKILSGKITQSDFVPEKIIGIKRGGVFLSTTLSYLLGKPVDYVESFEELKTNNTRTLLVDDICDSGKTFLKICKGIDNFKTTSLFFNVKQNFQVDFFARRIDRDKDKSWIVFPWEMNT